MIGATTPHAICLVLMTLALICTAISGFTRDWFAAGCYWPSSSPTFYQYFQEVFGFLKAAFFISIIFVVWAVSALLCLKHETSIVMLVVDSIFAVVTLLIYTYLLVMFPIKAMRPAPSDASTYNYCGYDRPAGSPAPGYFSLGVGYFLMFPAAMFSIAVIVVTIRGLKKVRRGCSSSTDI